jgi:hypothetical protein
MVWKFAITVLAFMLMAQVVLSQNKTAVSKSPPPRFLTVATVNQAKGQVVFDVQVVAQHVHDQPTVLVYPDGEQRLTLGTKPTYVHLAEGFKVSLKKARWRAASGKKIQGEAVAERLKPGAVVLLSADGAEVDPAYLRILREDTLVLILPVDDLPVPYVAHTGGTILIRKVAEP